MYCCPAERGRNGRFGSSRHVTSGSFGQRQPRPTSGARRGAARGTRRAARGRGGRSRVTHVFEALVRAEPSAVIAACDTVREMLANPASAVGGSSTPPLRQDWAASLRLASSPVRPSPLRAPANQSPRSEAWWRRNVDGKSRQEIARVAAAQRRGELTWRRRVDSMTRGLLPKKRGRKAKDTVSAESAQRTRSVATVAIGKALEALGARNGEKARALNSALLDLRAATGTSVRTMIKYNHMCAYTEAANGGNRRAVLLPIPKPLASSKRIGIDKPLGVPTPFPSHGALAADARRINDAHGVMVSADGLGCTDATGAVPRRRLHLHQADGDAIRRAAA